MFKPMSAAIVLVACGLSTAALGGLRVSFVALQDRVEIKIADRPFVTYVFRDATILRPYFAHLYAPSGVQVTRHHPPLAGEPADHDTMHPGVWLAFGDLSGADFWRNKATVRHLEFVEKPRGDDYGGSFTVRNRYVSGDTTICEEVCRVLVRPGRSGYLLVLDSRFTGQGDFYFGDQEEMGLGVRVAAPLAVKQGGQMTNSDGLSGEKQVWGKPADWCDYRGVIDGRTVGITLVPDPKNFRRSWFHARDYGFMAANPFGRNAFTKGEKSKVVVTQGESLRLRFSVLAYEGSADRQAVYEEALAGMQGP